MTNTVIIQMFVGHDDAISTRILYPKGYELGEKKISVSPKVKDALESFLDSAKKYEKSLLIEATLTKTRINKRLHYKSILHILNTTEAAVIDVVLVPDSKELSIMVWENDKWMEFQGYLANQNTCNRIEVATSRARCSVSTCVIKVEYLGLRSTDICLPEDDC